jgi:hypothetical protein
MRLAVKSQLTSREATVKKNSQGHSECGDTCEEEIEGSCAGQGERTILHYFFAQAPIYRQQDFDSANQKEERSYNVFPHYSEEANTVCTRIP